MTAMNNEQAMNFINQNFDSYHAILESLKDGKKDESILMFQQAFNEKRDSLLKNTQDGSYIKEIHEISSLIENIQKKSTRDGQDENKLLFQLFLSFYLKH